MNLQIYEEASEWLVKHRCGGVDWREKQAFDAWLRESPHHVRAYLEMSSVWQEIPSLGPSWNPSADELIARARADANVVQLCSPSLLAELDSLDEEEPDNRRRDVGRPQRVPTARTHWNAKLLYTLAASILIAFVGVNFHFQRDIYVTGIGEQRSLALSDGSTVNLNSRSRIKIRYTEYERLVELLEGQAVFKVAKNKARPFIVQTDDSQIRAVGTAFDVYRKTSGTVVTVIEGRVAVISRSAPTGIEAAGEILLAGGEQLLVTPASVAPPKQANIDAATAWTRRSLVFDSASLTEVAEEFNRHNARQLVIESPQLANFYISGVFSAVEPTLLLRFLRSQPELIVEETETEILIRKNE